MHAGAHQTLCTARLCRRRPSEAQRACKEAWSSSSTTLGCQWEQAHLAHDRSNRGIFWQAQPQARGFLCILETRKQSAAHEDASTCAVVEWRWVPRMLQSDSLAVHPYA